jgi:hypothetical protein
MGPRKSAPWTSEEDAELRRLAEAGYSAARLSVHFRRKLASVVIRSQLLGQTLKKLPRLPSEQRTKVWKMQGSGFSIQFI